MATSHALKARQRNCLPPALLPVGTELFLRKLIMVRALMSDPSADGAIGWRVCNVRTCLLTFGWAHVHQC